MQSSFRWNTCAKSVLLCRKLCLHVIIFINIIQNYSFQLVQLERSWSNHTEGFSFKKAFLSEFGEKYTCAFFLFMPMAHSYVSGMLEKWRGNILSIDFNLSVTAQDRARLALELWMVEICQKLLPHARMNICLQSFQCLSVSWMDCPLNRTRMYDFWSAGYPVIRYRADSLDLEFLVETSWILRCV